MRGGWVGRLSLLGATQLPGFHEVRGFTADLRHEAAPVGRNQPACGFGGAEGFVAFAPLRGEREQALADFPRAGV